MDNPGLIRFLRASGSLAFSCRRRCIGIFQRRRDGRCQIVLFAHHRFAALGFQRLARIACNGAALLRCHAVVGKAFGILAPGDFRGASLAQHGEDQLQIGHVVAQVVTGLDLAQALKAAVRTGRYAEGGASDFGGEDGIFLAFLNAARFPLAVSSPRTAIERSRFSIHACG